jgi:hypothetical protein
MGGSILGQLPSGKIDLIDVFTAGGSGFFSGYLIPTTSAQAVLIYGVAGAGQQIASDVSHGRDIQWGLVSLNAGLSAILVTCSLSSATN